MMLIDPRQYLADKIARYWYRSARIDLVATDVPTDGSNRFVVYLEKPPDNTVFIVKAVAMFAQERLNVGTPAETVRMLNPVDANGWFSYELSVNNSNAIESKMDMNSPMTAAAPLNSQRQVTTGISWLSSDPWSDVQKVWNPMFTVLVPSASPLKVVFSIPQLPAATPIPNNFSVGGSVAGTQRVDFAGVVMAGIQMPEQAYRSLVAQSEKMGPPQEGF